MRKEYRSFDLEKANISYDPPALRALSGQEFHLFQGNPIDKCAY